MSSQPKLAQPQTHNSECITPDQQSAASSQVPVAQAPKKTYARNYVCEPRLLRTKVAARYAGWSVWKIKRLIHDGKLRVFTDGERTPWLVDRADLDAYIEAHKLTY